MTPLLLAFNLFDAFGIALLLAMIGALLIIAEVFFPSGGLLGFFATVSLVGSIYYAFLSGGATTGIVFAATEVIVVPLLMLGALKILPSTPIGKALLGQLPTSEEVDPDDERHELVGRVGVARSKMLPSGAVEIDGRMIDAVSQGQAIEPGEYVKVIEVRGNRVVVRLAGQEDRPANENPEDMLARPIDELGIDSLDELQG